jgi:predicted RND superfamily exporter protein
LPYVNRVDGLTNFNYTSVDGDDLLVEDFVEGLPLTPEALAKKKKTALGDPLIPRFLLSQKADMTQISLRVISPKGFPEANMQLRLAAEKKVAALEAANPDLDVKLGGMVMLNTAFQSYAQKDLQTLVPAMFLLIILVLGGTLRSFWGVVLPMGLLISSVLFPVFLYVGHLGFSLTNPTMNVMQMLVAVAIADSVHLLALFFRGLRGGLDKRQAIVNTLEKNFVPCLITSVTTAIGFFSLMLQDIPPFVDLGLFAGTGVLYAWFVSVFTLPALLSLIPFKSKKGKTVSVEELDRPGPVSVAVSRWIVRKKLWILATGIAIFAGAVLLIPRIAVDSNAVKYFAKHTEFRQATEYIDANIIGTAPVEFNFDTGEPNGVYSPEALKKIERFTAHIADHPEYHITYVSSIVDVVKRLNMTLHGNDPAYYRIPDRDSVTAEGDTLRAKSLIAQYLLLYTMSLPQGMEITNQISVDNGKARATAFMRSISSWEQLRIVEELDAWLAQEMPEMKAKAVGVPVMFGHLMKIAIPGMLKGLAISILFITLVMMVTFRSFKVGLFSMIPNVWPLVAVFGVIGLTQYTVNLSVAVVGMITLGIAVDDTVYFLSKYLLARKKGLYGADAFAYSFRLVGAPLIFTSLILVAGFGSLTFSDFALNSDMGMLCSAVIALALAADLILLPAMILVFEKKEE